MFWDNRTSVCDDSLYVWLLSALPLFNISKTWMPVDAVINNVIPRTVAGVWTSFSENRRVWVGFDGGGRAVCVCDAYPLKPGQSASSEKNNWRKSFPFRQMRMRLLFYSGCYKGLLHIFFWLSCYYCEFRCWLTVQAVVGVLANSPVRLLFRFISVKVDKLVIRNWTRHLIIVGLFRK